jgi:hypothetical protein
MEFTFTFQIDCKHEYWCGEDYAPFQENEFLRCLLQNVLDKADTLKKYKIKVSNLVAKPREDSGRIWKKADTSGDSILKGEATPIGIERTIDDLGRIVIPKEYRNVTDMHEYVRVTILAFKDDVGYGFIIRKSEETEKNNE